MRNSGKLFRKMIGLINRLRNLIYNSSELRIKNFIKSLARDYGREIKGASGIKRIPIQLTYLEIAKITSTSPDKVRSVFKDMIDNGTVRFSEKKLLIRYDICGTDY